MGEADWTALTDGLNIASVDRGVTTGIARPTGGGSFIFGFNSLVLTAGAAGYLTNQANFAPTLANKGGSVRGAIKRGLSSGRTGFSPLLYIVGQGLSVNDSAYILGLQDDDPYRIALRKGAIVDGVPAADIGDSGILRLSTDTFDPDTWHHLRLDAVVNVSGDVILKVFESVLGNVTAPSWVPIDGLEDADLVASHGDGTAFVDDSIGVNSGSAPFTSGYMGFAFQSENISRRGYFDHIECMRQT